MMSLNIEVALSVAVRVYDNQVEVLVLHRTCCSHLVKHQIGLAGGDFACCLLQCSMVLREIPCIVPRLLLMRGLAPQHENLVLHVNVFLIREHLFAMVKALLQ
jgi:hypothetical protein